MVEPRNLRPEVARADSPFLVAAAINRVKVERLLHRGDEVFVPLGLDVFFRCEEGDGSEVIDAVVPDQRRFVADGHAAVVDGAAV